MSDGKLLGEGYVYAVRATPEMVAEHERQIDERKRWIDAKRRIDEIDCGAAAMRNLTTSQLEALADAWERIKAMGEGSAT